jgi:hypothetical protein
MVPVYQPKNSLEAPSKPEASERAIGSLVAMSNIYQCGHTG